MFALYYIFFYILLWSPNANGDTYTTSTTFCTIVNTTDALDKEKSLVLYRSLRISDFNRELKELYACIPVPSTSISYSNIDEIYYLLLSDLGVIPVEIPLFNPYYQSDNYLPIECGLKIADMIAGHNDHKHTTGVVYIDKRYFVTRSLSPVVNSLLDSNTGSRNVDVSCRVLDANTIVSRGKSIDSSKRIPFGPCDFDLFVISSRIGTALYSYVNSSTGLNMDPDRVVAPYAYDISSYSMEQWAMYHNSIDSYIQRFYLGVAALSAGSLSFFSQSDMPIVFAARHWMESAPYMIEFDNVEHVLTINQDQCSLNCFVKWKQYGTVQIIEQTMAQLLFSNRTDADVYSILVGCQAPNVLLARDAGEKFQVDRHQFNNELSTSRNEDRIKIYDGVIFSDEISLLLLRMEHLFDVVDYHIVIESKISFSGRSKPLVFDENKHLFGKFKHKIHHVILSELSTVPETLNDVWTNEYFSRNMLANVLDRVNASDNDLLLVSDTDEIPHPNALRNMRLYQQKPNNILGTEKIYKFNMKNYLYNFDCFDYKQFNRFTPLTGASIGTAKRLCGIKDSENDYEHLKFTYPTCMRLYMQHEFPMPFENVLSPGGWHLSFFSNLERIQNKLQNYGHQQFLEQFNSEKVSIDTSNASISEDWKKSFLKLDSISFEDINRNISVDLLRHRVANGLHINYNNINSRCIREELYQLDQYDLNIRALWSKMMTDVDRL